MLMNYSVLQQSSNIKQDVEGEWKEGHEAKRNPFWERRDSELKEKAILSTFIFWLIAINNKLLPRM